MVTTIQGVTFSDEKYSQFNYWDRINFDDDGHPQWERYGEYLLAVKRSILQMNYPSSSEYDLDEEEEEQEPASKKRKGSSKENNYECHNVIISTKES